MKLTIFIILNCIVCFSLAQAQGKCVPLPIYKGDPFAGYHVPLCSQFLQDSGFTHFWVDRTIAEKINVDQKPNPLDSDYIQEAFLQYVYPVQILFNAFSGEQPSPIAQNILLSSYCYFAIHLCDPNEDIDTYNSIDRHRPCPWLRDLFYENVDEFFSEEDLAYLATIGANFTDPESVSPLKDANKGRFATTNEDCVAPTFLSTNAQSARCESYTGEICKEIYSEGTQVYIPSGATQEAMEDAMAVISIALNALPRLETSTCAADVTRIMCQSVFRECVSYGIKFSPMAEDGSGQPNKTLSTPTTLPLALFPPYETCSSFLENCSTTEFFKYYTGIGGKIVHGGSCANDYHSNPSVIYNSTYSATKSPSTTWAFNQKSYYKRQEYTELHFDGPTGVYWGNTFAGGSKLDASYIPYGQECPSPLITSGVGSNAPTIFGTDEQPTICAIPCPSPVFTDKELIKIEQTAWWLLSFGLLCALILLISFLTFQSQRRKRITLNFVIVYFGLVITLFAGLLARNEQGENYLTSQCETPYSYYHMKSWTVVQGSLIVYFVLATAYFWLISCVDLVQRLVLGWNYRRDSSEYKRRRTAILLFGYVTPLFSVAGCLVAHQIGFNGYFPFSWITFPPLKTTDVASLTKFNASIYFMFLPLLASLLIGLAFMGVILYHLVKFDPGEGLKKFKGDSKSTRCYKFQQGLKLFGFAISVLPLTILLLVNEIVTISNMDKWTNDRIIWAQELLLAYAGRNVFTGQPIPLLSDSRPSISFLTAVMWAFVAPAFLLLLVYIVFSNEFRGLWAGWCVRNCRCGCQCCIKAARDDRSTNSQGPGSGTESSDGSTTGSNKPTQQSNDVFAPGFALSARARDAASRPALDVTSREDEQRSYEPVPLEVDLTTPEAMFKRKRMFRGMSAVPPQQRSNSKPRSTQTNDSTNGTSISGTSSKNGGEVELGTMGYGKNDDNNSYQDQMYSPQPQEEIYVVEESEENTDHN